MIGLCLAFGWLPSQAEAEDWALQLGSTRLSLAVLELELPLG